MAKDIIDDNDFRQMFAARAQKLLGLANHLLKYGASREILTRPLLGEMLSQSVQIEELLDSYGAASNCRWCSFRALTAATKLFSDVSYELLHIKHSLPIYRLLSIEQDFAKATEDTLDFTSTALLSTAKQMLAKAKQLELDIPSERPLQLYNEQLPPGRLARGCGTRRVEKVSETVTMLATAFLNLAADSKDVRAAGKAKPQQYASYVEDTVSEEKLRSLELRFHNLQSLYDTYVSGTEVENLDTDLPVLRGHISVVFHLLKSGTAFVHYYERHVTKQPCGSPHWQEAVVNAEQLLAILMKYSIAHICLYIACAERLCQDMLKKYAVIDRIEVPVPPYRGFHVRPATLISKLVLHYGSEVKMQMDDEVYNAGSSLELFRVNEKINAGKRRWLANEITRLKLVEQHSGNSNINDVIRSIVLTLAEQSKLILYEQPFQLPDEPEQKEGTLLERVISEMTQLQAKGKIDIETDLKVTFVGDKRVLADIKLLAESGYGEDNFGNNIPLPDRLSYLR